MRPPFVQHKKPKPEQIEEQVRRHCITCHRGRQGLRRGGDKERRNDGRRLGIRPQYARKRSGQQHRPSRHEGGDVEARGRRDRRGRQRRHARPIRACHSAGCRIVVGKVVVHGAAIFAPLRRDGARKVTMGEDLRLQSRHELIGRERIAEMDGMRADHRHDKRAKRDKANRYPVQPGKIVATLASHPGDDKQ